MEVWKIDKFEWFEELVYSDPTQAIHFWQDHKRDLEVMIKDKTISKDKIEQHKFYWTILELYLYFLCNCSWDMWSIEEIYHQLIKDDFEDHPKFPTIYKWEFLYLIGKLFLKNKWYSRSKTVILKLKTLNDESTDNEVAFRYIELLTLQDINMWSIDYESPNSYVDFIYDLCAQYELSEKQLKIIEFNCENKIYFEHEISKQSDKSFRHYYKCTLIYYELALHQFVHDWICMVHTLLQSFPEKAIELFCDFKDMTQLWFEVQENDRKPFKWWENILTTVYEIHFKFHQLYGFSFLKNMPYTIEQRSIRDFENLNNDAQLTNLIIKMNSRYPDTDDISIIIKRFWFMLNSRDDTYYSFLIFYMPKSTFVSIIELS